MHRNKETTTWFTPFYFEIYAGVKILTLVEVLKSLTDLMGRENHLDVSDP